MAPAVVAPAPAVLAPGCKPRVPNGTVRYFVRNDGVQEQTGKGLRWLLDRHPQSDPVDALSESVGVLCEELQQHVGEAALQCRSVKALCMLFKEYPESLQHVPDALSLVGLIVAALRRFPTDCELQEAGCRALVDLVVGRGELLVSDVAVFVDALEQHPQHVGIQEAACLVLGGILREPAAAAQGSTDAGILRERTAPACLAAERGAVERLLESVRRYLTPVGAVDAVVIAATSALAALLEKHPRSCATAAELDAVVILRDVLAKYPRRADVQVSACHALVQLFWRQPQTAAQASALQAVEVYHIPTLPAIFLKALQGHMDSTEVQAEVSSAIAWLVAGHSDAAESVALAGIAEAMMDGCRKHLRIRPVQEAVCHALSQLFDENNAIFSDNVRVSSLPLLLELIRREPGSAGTQMHASLALANLCAHHSGSAHHATTEGAIELLLAAHRQHFQDALVQGNALLAIARIIGSHPPSAVRAAAAGAVPRFTDALKQLLVDDHGIAHISAALAQLHTLAIREEPRSSLIRTAPAHLPALDALAQLLQRYPASGIGAARAGAAEALPAVLRACPAEATVQAIASCALGRLFLTQPHYTRVAVASGAVELLIAALRGHPTNREVQAQVCQTIALMMHAFPASATAVYEGGGDKVLTQAWQRHPEAEDLKVHITVAFRLLGKFVPALTPFPFVPAEPKQDSRAGTPAQPVA